MQSGNTLPKRPLSPSHGEMEIGEGKPRHPAPYDPVEEKETALLVESERGNSSLKASSRSHESQGVTMWKKKKEEPLPSAASKGPPASYVLQQIALGEVGVFAGFQDLAFQIFSWLLLHQLISLHLSKVQLLFLRAQSLFPHLSTGK